MPIVGEGSEINPSSDITPEAVTVRLTPSGVINLMQIGMNEVTRELRGGLDSAGQGVEKPGDAIGPYRLIQELGEGGFGVVWRAEQREPIHREVALKVIKPGMDTREVIARFEAERQALAMMDHPNIASVLDAGTTVNGRPYFVMELVKGVPITEYCDAHQLTLRARLELFIPVCQAVQHAHQKAILHRDLKPSNILVMEVDGKPVPKVIDFGIAKALGGAEHEVFQSSLARTQAGMVIGTPQYMSPEQAGSVPDVDTRSDIYTLGVILYELLTGQTPLTREELKKAALDEVLRLVREGEAKRPSSRFIPITELAKTAATGRHEEPHKLSQAIRGDLDWIVLKALEKDRTRRYDTVNALALDLRRHLQDEPVSAGPPSAGYRLRKLIRRKRGVFVAAAAVVAVLISGIVATSIALLRERKALARETEQRELALSNEKRAVENEKDALQEAENARRVSEFIQSLLWGATVEVANGKNADALIAAIGRQVPKLAETLGDQPEVQYQVTLRLAGIYQQFNLPREALPLDRQALNLARQIYGNDHEETLGRIHWVAIQERQGGDGEVAIVLFKECIERRRALGQTPDNNNSAFRALKDLAMALKKVGHKEEAQAAIDQACAVYHGRESRGELTDPDHLKSYAGLLRDTGRLGDALRLCQKLSGQIDVLPKTFDLAGLLTAQMQIERALGHEADAIVTCMRAIEYVKKQGSPDNWKVALSLLNFAGFLRDGKHWDIAEKTFADALAIAQLAGHHITLSLVHHEMRLLSEKQNKLEEAEVHARAGWEAAKKSNLPRLIVTRQGDLISFLDKRNKYEEASSLADSLWQTLNKTKWPDESPQLRSSLLNIAASVHEHWQVVAPNEDRVKAVRLWRERSAKAINWERSVLDNDFDVMLLYQVWWMATLIEEGRTDDYKKERARLLERVKDTTHPGIARRAARVALLLPAEGDALSQTMTLADRAMQKESGIDKGATTYSHLTKGLALYRADRFAESITTLNGALRDQQTHIWFATVAVMAMAHERLGHHADAVALLDKATKADPIKRAELESPVRRDEVSARVLLAEARKLVLPFLR